MAQNHNRNSDDASESHSRIDMGTRWPCGIGNLFPCCKRPKAASDFYDGSYDFYTMYNEKTDKIDKELVTSWSEHVRDMMVLSGLLAAAIASFLGQSYVASLQSDTTGSSLTQNQNATDPQAEEKFMKSMFHADVFWFWGLGASLSSAVLATLLQSWVRRYVVVTRVQQNPRCRALIREYVIREKSTNSLQLAVDFLHLLLDFAIFNFLIGTLRLMPPDATGGSLVMDPAWSNISLIVIIFPLFSWYIFLFLISFRRHTIYSTPLSRVVYNIGEYIKLILLFPISLLKSLLGRRTNAFIGFDWVTLDRVDKVAGKITKALPASLDNEIVAWLLGSLYHDQDFEQFLESIPGFYRSDYVEEPAKIFRPFHDDQIPQALMAFVHRTLSSPSISGEIKQKRIRLTLDVMELDPHLHQRTFSESYLLSPASKQKTLDYVDGLISDSLADGTNGHPETENGNGGPDVRLLENCITAIVISRLAAPQTPDNPWSTIIERRLRFQISVPASNEQIAGMKLVNIVRLVDDLRSASLKRRDKTVSQTLFNASNFQASGAGHQHKVQFCNLWNELQDSAAGAWRSNASAILPNIQTIYNTLHEGTDDPQVTPSLTPAHYLRCTTHVHYPRPPLTPEASTGPG